MPQLSGSTYYPPFLLQNPHVQTVFPTLFRKVKDMGLSRCRYDTPDGDFLDVDYVQNSNKRAALICHGLESDARRHYILGMARALLRRGWDVFALNYRGCSGEPNRLYSAYHSGKSDDVGFILDRIQKENNYDALALIGFSVGGNISLKLGGEMGRAFQGKVAAIAAMSAPCDLAGSAHTLEQPRNAFYLRRFTSSLRNKILEKHRRFGGNLSEQEILSMETFTAIDNLYTAPAHGFIDALDYWRRNSSLGFLGEIAVPSLLISAADDPFLSPECFPQEIARNHKHLTLEIPKHGGHLGFVTFHNGGEYWHEKRIADFLEQYAR